MSRTRVRSNAFALLACSILLVASIGCNPGAVTAPDSSPQAIVVDSPNFVRILSTSKGESQAQRAPGTVSQMVSAQNGGTVTNGRVTLKFPPNALSQDTEITITLDTDGTLGAEFGPHGIQFNRAVTMSMDLRGTDMEGRADETVTLYNNEDLGQWELVDEAPSSNLNFDKAYLYHFSGYKGGVDPREHPTY